MSGFKFNARGNRSAEVLIYEDIGPWSDANPKAIAKELKAAGQIDELAVRISSYGGDVFDGLAIYQMLEALPARISVFVDGIAASAASVIAMAGDEIIMAKHAEMMVHDAWTVTAGNADQLLDIAGRLETTSQSLAEIYAARTKRGIEDVRALMKAETWMTAAQAVDLGFATSIDESADKIAAKYDPARHAFRNMPKPKDDPAPDTAAIIPFDAERFARLVNAQARIAAHRKIITP